MLPPLEGDTLPLVVVVEADPRLRRSRLVVVVRHDTTCCFVYADISYLVAILDEQEIEEKCHARKEFFLRQKKRIDSNTILEKVTEDMVVAYIVSKIDLQAICEDRYQILFESTNNEGDAHTKASFIFPKPHNLEPFVVHYNTLAS